MDCKLLICELMNDLKCVKETYLEEQLLWHGVEKKEISKAIKVLIDRGVIYKKRGGNLEMTEPLST